MVDCQLINTIFWLLPDGLILRRVSLALHFQVLLIILLLLDLANINGWLIKFFALVTSNLSLATRLVSWKVTIEPYLALSSEETLSWRGVPFWANFYNNIENVWQRSSVLLCSSNFIIVKLFLLQVAQEFYSIKLICRNLYTIFLHLKNVYAAKMVKVEESSI